MPDITEPKPVVDNAANNAAVKAALEAQGAEKLAGAEADLQEGSDALDALAAAANKSAEEPKVEADPVVEDDPAAVVDPVVEVDPAPEPTPEEKAATEAAAKAEEYFKDSPTLPPNASPKSSAAFQAVKQRAAQEIAAREARIAETEAKLAEAEAKANKPADEALLKEIEDHRLWRARLDVDADPKFKEFDKTIASTHEFIYAQLRKSPSISDSVIDQIKKLGGPEFVNLDKIFASIKDSTTQRIVESKVAEVEMLRFNKEEAVKSTKANVQKYLDERNKSADDNATAHNRATRERLGEYTKKLEWLAPKPVDAKADEATRKAAQEHNAFVEQTKKQVDAALNDDSVEMRAIMLTATAQLLYLQKLRPIEKAERDALAKELTETKAKLAKLTNAGSTRLREGAAAPTSGRVNVKPKEHDFSVSSGDALDAIARQVTEERARKANA